MSAPVRLVESGSGIPANRQRGCGQAPLFALILEWSVCLGAPLGPASITDTFLLLSEWLSALI